jgi:small ligand-binding sensory domain FIST
MLAGVAVSTSPTSALAAQEAARWALAAMAAPKADAAIIFASGDHAAEARSVVRAVQEITGATAVVGCGASGVLSALGEHEAGPSIGVMVLSGVTARASFLDSTASSLGEDALTIALVDPRGMTPALLCAINASRCAVGGGASADLDRLFVAANGEPATGSAAVLSIGGPSCCVAVTHACLPLGPSGAVTRKRGRAILEIDGESAAKRFVAAARDPIIGDPRRAPAFVFVAIGGEPGRIPRRGEFYIRPVLGLDPEGGGLLLADELPEGTPLTFALREAISARRDLTAAVDGLLADLPAPPKAALYFDCVGRGSSLYGAPSIDSLILRQRLPGVPLLGMFSAFEIGPAATQTRLLMYSGVLAVLCDPA